MTIDEGERVWPVVLVGGMSRRFGRDKLREPIAPGGRSMLVDVAIGALRAVFEPIVAVVGACDPAVAARADRVIADAYPGVGPMGGVLSALESCGSAVMVLPGDLCVVGAGVVPAILAGARAAPGAMAVLAETDRVEWCVGVYRPAIAPILRRAIESNQTAFHRTVPADVLATVRVATTDLRDADRPEDLCKPAH